MSARVWVITGTNSGLGFALARYVLAQGDKVVATVRSMAKFPKELEAAGAHPVLLDMTSSDDAIKCSAEEAIQAFGSVDVLVNNAGVFSNGVGPVEEISMDDIKHTFQANVFGTISFTQPFIKHFRLRKSGQILNFSSVSSYVRSGSTSAYSASKAALEVFSDTLQSELTPYNVRVLNIIIGVFPTNIFTPRPLSSVYTDPVTQGYDTIRRTVPESAAAGILGDIDIFAVRVFEIVAGTGRAEELVIGEGERREWNKIPLGCYSFVLGRTVTTLENVRALEHLCSELELDADKACEYSTI